jgi:alpha-N-arabinofuranosidase
MKLIQKVQSRFYLVLLLQVWFIGLLNGQQKSNVSPMVVKIYPDSIVNDISNHPIGINVDFFMDNDQFLHPKRSTVDALKAMGVRYLRYPGGEKSDLYLFSKPPYDTSHPTLARTGKGAVGGYARVLNEDFTDFNRKVLNFDEFITMCRQVGAEPIVVVAADMYLKDIPAGNTLPTREQLIKNAVEWVRYSNIKKKYNVRYWMIGNESWHKDNKNSSADIYAQDVIDFSIAMKAVDPSVKIIPNGNTDEFWKVLLTKAAGHFDELCLSNYPVFNYARQYYTYRDTLQNLMRPVQTALNAIDKYATNADKKKLKVIVAEYGPFDWAKTWPFINTMGYNLVNFEIIGNQLLEPRVDFSCFWNTRWIQNDSVSNSVFDALDKDGNFNANGYGIAIWGNFLGDKMVKTTSSLYIRSFASWKPKQKKIFMYLVNKSDEKKMYKLISTAIQSNLFLKAGSWRARDLKTQNLFGEKLLIQRLIKWK